MVWFKFMQEQGLLDSQTNPEPVAVENGYQVPFWKPLTYLEKLAREVAEGRYPEAVDAILGVIQDVHQHPKDNYSTWYAFLRILSKLPREAVPLSLLKSLPRWFDSRFDTMLQSSGLCEHLLPHFLPEDPGHSDREKAELLVGLLFRISKRGEVRQGAWNGEGESYQTMVYPYYLSPEILHEGLVERMARTCSVGVLWGLVQTLKDLLIDFPHGILEQVEVGSQTYLLRALPEGSRLQLFYSTDTEIAPVLIGAVSDYEHKDKAILVNRIADLLKTLPAALDAESSNQFVQRVVLALTHDFFSMGEDAPIHLLDEEQVQEKIIPLFALLLRNLLRAFSKEMPEESRGFVAELLAHPSYQYPFFKRMVLYQVAQAYSLYEDLFWDTVAKDLTTYLSEELYFRDLSHLFEKNSTEFTSGQLDLLQRLIAQGCVDPSWPMDEDEQDLWRLGWYSALKAVAPFATLYEDYSQRLQTTTDYFHSKNKVQIRSGSMSPLSTAQILDMEVSALVSSLLTFEPGDRWEGPTVEGFADALGRAAETEPGRFAAALLLFEGVDPRYIYSLLYGLGQTWHKAPEFDWAPVLTFCELCISNFQLDQPSSKPDEKWEDVNKNMLAGSIAWLLLSEMDSDRKQLPARLLPQTKCIILSLNHFIRYKEPEGGYADAPPDYMHILFNSTAGKLVRALLDYALLRARLAPGEWSSGHWEADVAALFTVALNEGTPEAYCLLGYRYSSFHYLDPAWTERQLKYLYTANDAQWYPFIEGLSMARPPLNPELYPLLLLHYEKALEADRLVSGPRRVGLVHHLAGFYFKDYMGLEPESLIGRLVRLSPIKVVRELVINVWQQEQYLKQHPLEEQVQIREKVMALWALLLDRYENGATEEERMLPEQMVQLARYVPHLDERTVELLRRTMRPSRRKLNFRTLLDQLVRLKAIGEADATAKQVATLLKELDLPLYSSDKDKARFGELVRFLFEQGQAVAARQICNRMAIAGHHFLRPLYEEFVER